MMPEKRDHWTIRVLLDGHRELTRLLAATPASRLPGRLLLKLSLMERQLRPITEIANQRRAALAAEYGVETSPDGSRYVRPDGEDGAARFLAFQHAVNEWLEELYPMLFEPIDWDEAAQSIPGLTALHFAMMPFAWIAKE
jgi:hypothetical protein